MKKMIFSLVLITLLSGCEFTVSAPTGNDPTQITQMATNPCYIHMVNMNGEFYICDNCNEELIDGKSNPIGHFLEPRYIFTKKDINDLAVLLCGDKNVDGDGEYDFDFENDKRYDQISLVLSVVMNRVRNDKFPNTVQDVIWAPDQFTPMMKWINSSKKPQPSDIALLRVTEWCEAYARWDNGCQGAPENHLYFSGDDFKNDSRLVW